MKSSHYDLRLPLDSTQSGSLTAPDGIRLFIHNWPSATPPKGILFFGHGILEHSGRYEEWGRAMAAAGYSVFAIDHRGHGKSQGKRAWVRRFTDFVDDFEAFVREGARLFPDLPVFIVGMSMGGGIAIQTTPRAQETVPNYRGTVLVAPATRLHPHLFPKLRYAARLLNIICPRLAFIKGNASGLSRLAEVRADFDRDPDVYRGRISVHFGYENFIALDQNHAAAAKITAPLLLLQGSGDLIVNPAGAEEFFQKVASQDKTLKIYPNLYHDILHESEKTLIFQDIIDWLNLRAKNKPS